MSLITSIGRKLLMPAAQKLPKQVKTVSSQLREEIPCAVDTVKHCADDIQYKMSLLNYNITAQYERLVQEYAPEATDVIKQTDKELKNFAKFGFESKGEMKYFLQEGTPLNKKNKLLTDRNFMQALLNRKSLVGDETVLKSVSDKNKNSFIKLLKDTNITDEQFKNISGIITKENAPILKQLLADKDFNSNILKGVSSLKLNKSNMEVLRLISKKGNIDTQEMISILENTNRSNSDLAMKLVEKAPENAKGLYKILHNVAITKNDYIKLFTLKKEILQCKITKLAGGKYKEAADAMIKEREKLIADFENAVKYRRQFLSELLENPTFKFGADFQSNYDISQIIGKITPENYESILKDTLRKNSDLGNVVKKYPSKLERFYTSNSTLYKDGYNINSYSDSMSGLLKGIETAKEKYGVIPQGSFKVVEDTGANDLFKTVINDDKTIAYKFDKKTDELVSVYNNGKTINIKNGTDVTDSMATELKGYKVPNELTKSLEDLDPVPYRIDTSIKGKNGKFKTLYTESDIKGQYDIYHTNSDGTKTKIGYAKVTPNGAKHVKRTLTSSDGTKTQFAYREDKAGNSYYHSVITTKAGEKISDVKRNFKVLSDNHFISTKDGQAYDILFTDTKVRATKLDAAGNKTNQFVEYKIQDVPEDISEKVLDDIEHRLAIATLQGKIKEPMTFNEELKFVEGILGDIYKKYGIEPKTIDRKTVEMLKRLPGDEWFAMSKSCDYVVTQSSSAFGEYNLSKSIVVAKELSKNLGAFCHELGHAKFHKLGLKNDNKLMSVYNAEKKAFTSRYPESRIGSIDYFLNQDGDDVLRGLDETGAETNLMTDTIQSWDQIQDRTIFLEQYFPKTIAYIRQKFATLG